MTERDLEAKILKIRHVGPKRRRLGLSGFKTASF